MCNQVRFAGLLLSLVLLCSGCGATYLKPSGTSSGSDIPAASGTGEQDNSPNSNTEIKTNFAPDLENRRICGLENPSVDKEGAYIQGMAYPTVSYFDFDSGLMVPLCTQQGCQHQDESCLAYQGMLFDFDVYQDNWYALTSDRKKIDDNAHLVQLVQTDSKTNQRKILWEYKDPECYLSGLDLILSHGNAWFQLQITREEWKQNQDGYYSEVTTESKLVCVNLETGESQVFTSDAPTGRYQFWGGSENGFAYTYSFLDMQLLSEEAYLEQNPDSTPDDYLDYSSLNEFLNTKHQLIYHDVKTGQDTVVCDNVQMSDSVCCYGDALYYRTIDRSNGDSQIDCLDLTTGKTSHFWKDVWIVDYTTFDNKLFCIKSMPDGPTDELGSAKADFYAVDLTTGEKYMVPNHGDDYAMYFRIDSETKERFLGFCEGRMASIRKEDFWGGKFDNLGPLP